MVLLSMGLNFTVKICSQRIFLVSYVEERPWWPMQSSRKEERSKRNAKRREGSDQVD